MATYLELLAAQENDGLRQKVRIACVIAAEVVRTEATGTTNHANRLIWARSVLQSPERAGDAMIWAVLAQQSSQSINTILNATDAQIQTAVNGANYFAGVYFSPPLSIEVTEPPVGSPTDQGSPVGSPGDEPYVTVSHNAVGPPGAPVRFILKPNRAILRDDDEILSFLLAVLSSDILH